MNNNNRYGYNYNILIYVFVHLITTPYQCNYSTIDWDSLFAVGINESRPIVIA